jgi:hypothetical protein
VCPGVLNVALITRAFATALLVLPARALAAAAPPCSLNGVLDSGGAACVCDVPWTGPACEFLDERPAAVAYGAPPTLYSWGGNVVEDAEGVFHLFVAEMEGFNCTLNTWQSNSACVHATAPTPMGPFVRQGVAVDVWCHNPSVLPLRDGTLALFHIGGGTGQNVSNCSAAAAAGDDATGDATAGDAAAGFRVRGAGAAPGSTLHLAASPAGPWTPSAHPPPSCNNPAPLLHPNGTFFLLCDSNTLFRAPTVAGPWTQVWVWNPETEGGPAGGYEDGFLWLDKRGAWHTLYHVWDNGDFVNATQCVNSTVSAHSFSEDGLRWFVGKAQPYNTSVVFATGGPAVVSPTRERPKLLFAADGVTPRYLFNGAVAMTGRPCAAPWCASCKRGDKSYTLVVPLGHDGAR